MPQAPPVAGEHLTQLLHLPAAGIARKPGCTPRHHPAPPARPPLRTGWLRPAGSHFTPGPEQQAVMAQFQASRARVSGLASPVGCASARLFNELSGRVPMPEQRYQLSYSPNNS